jgi:signal transduction histidine kinase/CheY-like chemotaxis protein
MTHTRNPAGQRLGFLSTEAASRGERRLAGAVVVVSLLAFLLAAPFVRAPLTEIPAFIPAYEAALWITDTITAVLLFGQFMRLRSRALLALGAGYLFESWMVVAHMLSFPGVFAPSGLLGAGSQTTAWLYVFWHGGFPLFVLAYALLARRPQDALAGSRGRAVALAVFLVGLGVVGLTLLTTAGHDLLPVVVRNGDYSRLVTSGTSPAIWAVTATVLLVLWFRSVPTVLDLWLMVVMLASALDLGFSAVLGSHRFDLGFYAGRAYGLMASSFVLGALLFEMNRLYASVAHALDLAETRNLELARSREEFARVQRFEAVGQLVGGVAHDFNNLLTVITGGLDLLLRDSSLGGRNRRLVHMSMKAAQRGEQLTQQLLTFARRQVLRPEVLDANEVIAGLHPFLARAAGEGMELVLRLGHLLSPARLDRTQFETALVNLVLNARDASDGEGRIVIETRNTRFATGVLPDVPPGDYVQVSVSDTGRGMTPDVVARAFEPFFTTKDVGKGSGLGLSQVHGFVGSAGGQLRIESAPDQGTTVSIYLPKSAERSARLEPVGLPPIRPATAHETVLVVEDDPDVLDIAVRGLQELGYEVKTASDAREALDILGETTGIDVLFSDVVMPGGMNGAQLAVAAQRIRPDLKVLLTSGYTPAALSSDHGLPERLEVLRKPYRREDLATTLQRVMRR